MSDEFYPDCSRIKDLISNFNIAMKTSIWIDEKWHLEAYNYLAVRTEEPIATNVDMPWELFRHLLNCNITERVEIIKWILKKNNIDIQ